MRVLSTFLLIFCFAIQGWSQMGTVTGRIVSKANKGFPGIVVSSKNDKTLQTKTNLDGAFHLQIPTGEQKITIQFQSEVEEYTVQVNEGETTNLGKIKLDIQYYGEVSVRGKGKDNTIDDLPVIETARIPGPESSVEKYITLTTAATSNNELTNNYNVRGGSYDENLVYVNGFQVYRPFLTRSGEQEGMSFINPALVKSINFSAGGFGANYGDRLSSVLDINYREPDRFRGSFDASFLGASAHVEDQVGKRFNYMLAGRYRDQGYLLNALPVKGAYQPKFYDVQLLTNYSITENLKWSVLGHFSSNDYFFAPQTQETKLGTVNQPLSLKVYFEGQEVTRFQTITGATSLKWNVNKRTNLALYAKVFNTDERETFDVLGEYFINELETDPDKEAYGDSVGTIGVGGFLNHARNRLLATVYSLRHEGEYKFLTLTEDGLGYNKKGKLNWGVSAQYEDFTDRMSEWELIDSAGYSLPQNNPNVVELNKSIKAKNTLSTFRTSGYVTYTNSYNFYKRNYPISLKVKTKDSLGNKIKYTYRDTLERSRTRLTLNVGLRGGYTAFNKEGYATPRASISYFPSKYYINEKNRLKKRYLRIHMGTGLYYQPPFYRELRRRDGTINTATKSQKSFHFVAGADYAFEMWQRKTPFKLSGELFYKYLWDVNPYSIDNLKTMYYARNNAVGHSYGLDINLHGEFIDGIQSFFKIGLLRAVEDLKDDDYYTYINSDGEDIVPGYTFNDTPVDSTKHSPGFIPKPTDQWFTLATLFQDRMPGIEQFTVQLGLNFGTRLPYGPPGDSRYKDTLRQKSYFRVDIGFGYDFLYKKPNKKDRIKLFRPFTAIQLNFEVYNLLGINNVLSHQWLLDTEGRYLAVPNYLTQRRFSLKLILRW